MKWVFCGYECIVKRFFQASRENESLPDPNAQIEPLPADRKVKVYTGYDVIAGNLHHPRFEIVPTEEEADILWLNDHFKTFRLASFETKVCKLPQQYSLI